MSEMIGWAVFVVIVVIFVSLDLYWHREPKAIPARRALQETAMWIIVAVAFGVFVLYMYGSDRGMEYFAAFVMEKSMSVDNLFVFIIIFAMFSIPAKYQHKVLFYGIIGAIAFRLVFMLVGTRLMQFEIVLFLFGILLLYAAYNTITDDGTEGESGIAKFFMKHTKTSPELDGDHFFTHVDGVRMMTPLLLCLIVIEVSDLIFAFDSIPAVLSLSDDLMVIYTSNIFAILGLRSLYFAIRGGLDSLKYLKYGLFVILVFIALKLMLKPWISVSISISLLVIVLALCATIVASVWSNNRAEKKAERK